MDNNEKIIECVRKFSCLYDPSDKNYKNAVFKAKLWQEIAEQLNESSDTLKRMWKSMRDGYIKYKKQIKGTTGSEKKPINFLWSGQLSFLDSCINPRETVSNVSGDRETPTSENSDSAATLTFIENESFDSSNAISTLLPPSNEPIETPRRVKKRTKEPDERDIDEMIKTYLEKKEKPRHDDVDYLILSYAQTFKKLSPRKQAMLKVDLAKLFSDAELNGMPCIDNIHQSPAYSVMSSGSDNINSADTSTATVNSFIHANVEQTDNTPQDLSNSIVFDHTNVYSTYSEHACALSECTLPDLP